MSCSCPPPEKPRPSRMYVGISSGEVRSAAASSERCTQMPCSPLACPTYWKPRHASSQFQSASEVPTSASVLKSQMYEASRRVVQNSLEAKCEENSTAMTRGR
eukprot:scaffold70822_cov92-Phaeocystis_antarctica.AAC.2